MQFFGFQFGASVAKRMLLSAVFLAGVCSASSQTATNIQVTGTVQQPSVHRLGVNLGDQTYWDSGQMLKNLVFQNPGFEGLKFRTIMKCAHLVSASACQDDNQYSGQYTGFWVGGTYLVMSGNSAGMKGSVVQSTKANSSCSGCGQTIKFDQNVNLAVGDYFVLSNAFPGTGDSGWWDNVSGGGTITTEFNDLSPNTPGKQAVLLSASGKGQIAKVTQYFDSYKGLSFIQLNGAFQVTFRAKGVGGDNQLTVSVQRLQGSTAPYLNQTLQLTNSWKDYTLTFSAAETGSALGTVQLVFDATGANVELDDVAMQQTNSDPSNKTVFRDDVVNTLKQLNPGTIRMMAAGAALGSDIPNQLATPFARYREAFSSTKTSIPAVSYGIGEFLQLCATVGSDPWITIPTATTPAEMTILMQYLSGNGSDSYSAARIARGQTQPWTSVFNKIHIELGNETWNGDFKGESMAYPGYPQWANGVFGAARKFPGYQSSKFDLVLDGWAAVPGYNYGLLSFSTQHDSIDIAPYLLYGANNESQSLMFGALFAEPELFSTPGGEVYKTMQFASTASVPTQVSVYEVNLGTMVGKITQPQLDTLTPSVGAGIAHTVHMLEMMRLGVQYQNAFALQQYQYLRSDQSVVRLWGIVVDMGTTNRRRPQFLTQALANTVIGGSMLQTLQTGANPTWNQPKSSDGVTLATAHALQSFAFVNQGVLSTVVFNLSQTSALPVTFSGSNAPSGTVKVSQITSANITDNNETANNVKVTTNTLSGFNASTTVSLPPFSMTVFTNTSPTTQPPSFSLAAGTYGTAQSVTITDATAGAAIYYTTDGSTPTTSSTLYASPVTISKSATLQAFATANGLAQSGVTSAAYVIGYPTAAPPTFSLAAGTYKTAQTVTIKDATAGATIYYTTDGSTPSTSSAKYTSPVTIGKSVTLQAIAGGTGFTTSGVTKASYVIGYPVAATPTFSLASGSYKTAQSVKIADATAGTTIYYTVDGSTPTKASKKYTAAIAVTSNKTIKAIAAGTNLTTSAVATAVYTITLSSVKPPAATPTFSVPAATYSTSQNIAIKDATAGAIIYYTVDGTTPTTASKKYTAAISVPATITIKAMATATKYSPSAVASGTYTIATGSTNSGSGFKSDQMVMNGSAKLTGSTLVLTDGGRAEISAAWYAKKVSVSSFTTDFTFQMPKSIADGFTFTLQNSRKGTSASGGNGDALGYASITNSLALKFTLYDSAKKATASYTGMLKNGANPPTQTINMAPAKISLHTGHVMQVHLVYDGATLVQTVTDTKTGAVFIHSYTVNIPALLGSNAGYVGFTASTGAFTAVQNVLTWTYSTGSTPAKRRKIF